MHTEGLGDWKAVDLFEGTQDLLNKFADGSDVSVWEHLRQTANRTGKGVQFSCLEFLLSAPLAYVVDGRQAVYDAAIGTLCTRPEMPWSIKFWLISSVMNILNNSNEPASKLAKCDLNEVKEVFADCKDNDYISIARRFLVRYTTCTSYLIFVYSDCRA